MKNRLMAIWQRARCWWLSKCGYVRPGVTVQEIDLSVMPPVGKSTLIGVIGTSSSNNPIHLISTEEFLVKFGDLREDCRCVPVERRLESTWIVSSKPDPDDLKQLPNGSYVMKDDPDEWPVDPETGDFKPMVGQGAFDNLVVISATGEKQMNKENKP